MSISNLVSTWLLGSKAIQQAKIKVATKSSDHVMVAICKRNAKRRNRKPTDHASRIIDIASYRSSDMNMATVYLKGDKTIEVPLEELEDYLYNNADKIETRHIQRRRPPTEGAFTRTVTTQV